MRMAFHHVSEQGELDELVKEMNYWVRKKAEIEKRLRRVIARTREGARKENEGGRKKEGSDNFDSEPGRRGLDKRR